MYDVFLDYFKKSFLANISENINISRKKTFFRDHFDIIVFWPYFRKYQHFQKNIGFLKSLEENFFLPIFSKMPAFEQDDFLWISFYVQKYNLSKKAHYFEITLKIVFTHIYHISWVKGSFFFRSLWKYRFCSYIRKYQHFVKKYLFFLDHFENIFFYPYLRKYQHSWKWTF